MAELNELTINGSNYTFEDDVARGLATAEKSRAQAIEQSLQTAINGKVDKVAGKGLSTNDYTDAEKAKLAELENYDDTQVRQLIAQTNANFANYYTKAESYSAVEVDTLLRIQRQGQFVVVNTLPVPSADTMFKIYLVPSTNPEAQNVKDEFVTLENNGTYSWEQIGTTAVDLSGYSTTEEMNAAIASALASYYTKSEVDEALGGKQNTIDDLANIRSGASAGATAVQPSTLNSALSDTVAESGVYDVTANNNNAKFASLSALLGSENLDTLIPSAKRKGGMSIKFVLSSDNKYVQARCMAQNFTTDITQWQGVDDEPTAGSENLIKSGSVAAMRVENYTLALSKGYLNRDTGQKASTADQNWECSELVRLDRIVGDSIILNKNTSGNNSRPKATGIVAYDEELEPVFIGTAVGAFTYNKADLPATAVYVAFSFYNKSDVVVSNYSVWDNIHDIKRTIQELESNIDSKIDAVDAKVEPEWFTGKGNTFSYVSIKNIIPQNRYRIYFQNSNWDVSSITATGVYKFAVTAVYNGTNTDLVTVPISDTVKPYYEFIAPATFDEIRIGGRANTDVKVVFDIVNITAIEDKSELVPYFASLNVPTFSEVDLSVPTLKIKFPSSIFRLYTAWGVSLIGEYTGAANQTFTITNLQSLVWDFNDSSVKVVNTGTKGNYIRLLNVAKNSVTGLFAGWFNKYAIDYLSSVVDNEISKVEGEIFNFGKAQTVSKDYDITSGMSGFSAQVEIGIPYNSKFTFRLNDPDGALNYVSNLKAYDYEGNDIAIAVTNLAVNNTYTYTAPCGLKSIRCWVGASYMTGTAGTISIQVSVPSQYIDEESIVERWNEDDKLLIRNNLTANADFKALFFSDIHGQDAKFERIIQLGNDWKNIIDCIVDGGDDTNAYKAYGNLDWYNTRALTSEKPIVRAAGNHDAWTTNYGVWATNQELYEYFTAVAVAQLTAKGATVVQPSDAATAYKNYYYVDFGSLRMIVITSFTGGGYYDTDQATWFAGVLSDAVTNDKSVICLNHAPMPLISAVENVECNWCSYKTRISDGTIMQEDPLDKVDAFIRAGGKFVCWLTGHTHIDFVMKYSKTVDSVTKTQFAFTTSCAKGGTNDGVQPGSKTNVAYDLFNMISVDLTNHLLKIWRIGFNINAFLQVHNTFVWDFVNNRIVSES